MNTFTLPFTIVYPNPKDYILERCYEKKQASYRISVPSEQKMIRPLLIQFKDAPKNLELELEIRIGNRAEATVKMLIEASDVQNLSLNAQLVCEGRQSKGELVMKGVARDHATLNFNGLVHISKDSAGSSAHLKQEILNLSPHTSVRATPALKIDTNDVKAGHSAAIRNLNEEDLFYFAARGIKTEKAKKLLIEGFFESELKELV